MPPAARISVRKKHGLRLGYSTVTCKIGPQRKRYSVHRDLLCKSSAFFRNAIQPNRRAVDGDCPICHEALQSGASILTYCSASCGGNFHDKCIDEWKRQIGARPECPLCRCEWKAPPSPTQFLPSVSESGFEIYVEWLYRARIFADDDTCYEHLIEAYVLGTHVADQAFSHAILQCMIEVCVDDDDLPDAEAVKLAYEKTTGPCSMRALLVGLSVRFKTETGHTMLDAWDDLPDAFLRDFAKALMDEVPAERKIWTLEALVSELLPDVPDSGVLDGGD